MDQCLNMAVFWAFLMALAHPAEDSPPWEGVWVELPNFSSLGSFFFSESEFSICQLMCQVELSGMHSFSSLCQKQSCILNSYICNDNNKKNTNKFVGWIESFGKSELYLAHIFFPQFTRPKVWDLSFSILSSFFPETNSWPCYKGRRGILSVLQ